MNRSFLLLAMLCIALAGPAAAQSSRRGSETQSPNNLSASEAEWCGRVQQDIEARTRWLTQEREALARQSSTLNGMGVSADETAGGSAPSAAQASAYNALVAEHRQLVNAYNARLTVVNEQSAIILRSIEVLRERCLRQQAPRRVRPAD